MSSTTASSWHDEKPKHARDVARALERLRRDASAAARHPVSLEDLPEFHDIEKFAALGERILADGRRMPAASFTHSKHFRGVVRGAHRALFPSPVRSPKDVKESESPFRVRAPVNDETETTEIPRSISFATGSPKEETSPETPTLCGARASETTRAVGCFVLVFVTIALLALITGVIVCDVCAKNFEELTTTTSPSC